MIRKRGRIFMTFWEAIKNQSYYEYFMTRSTYHTNRIEGNTLTYVDTYAIIFNDNSFKVSAKPREIYEAINHKYALNSMLEAIRNGERLSERLIINLAVLINKSICDTSGYRTVPVLIRGAEHHPIPPKDIKQAMLCYVYNYNHDDGHSIYEKIADYHIRFERIHPFEDGNGRTGRLLINFGLLSDGKAPIVINQDDRSEYFEYLAKQDVLGLAGYIKDKSIQEQENIDALVIEQAVDEVLENNSLLQENEELEL